MDFEFALEVMKICGEVVQSRHAFTSTESLVVSCNLLDWITLHKGNLDKEKFLALTDKEFLPNISSEVALKYLQVHESIDGAIEDASCLQKRCVCAIMKSSICMAEQAEVAAALKSLSQPVLADLVVSSMYSDKHTMKQCCDGPHCVIAKGSSYSGLNGIFQKEEKAYNLCPVYRRDADELGATCCFMIVHYEGEKRWLFVVAKKDPRDGWHWNEEATLYTAFSDSSGYPPAWGWYSCHGAVDTAPPVLLFRRKDQ